MPGKSGRKQPPIAICNFDFRGSGTVAKSIEIAAALRSEGLPPELWCVSEEGPLRARVPSDIPVRALFGSAWLPRRRMMKLSIPLLALMIAKSRPAVLLSGGNHMHNTVRRALALSGRRDRTRFGVRASNSSQRPGKPPPDRDRLKKYRGADFVVAVTSALLDDIRKSETKGEVHVIANGVDLDRIASMIGAADEAQAPGSGPLLVAMGRIAHQKGFDILVDAVAMLERTDVRLAIVGAGGETDVAALEAQIAEQGLQDRISLTGFLANPFPLIARADLFVSASRWEGASNSLLEALACGAPIVATDCPTGNAAILEGGEYGRLVPVDDAAALAEAIDIALAEPVDRERQTARAAEFALTKCLDQWTALLTEEYRRALALR